MRTLAITTLFSLALIGCTTDDDDAKNGDDDMNMIGDDDDDDDIGDDDDDDDAVVENASIRVIHASPDAPEVDVWAKGGTDPIFTGLAWGDASEYIDVPIGDYTLELRAAGSDASAAPAFTVDVTLGEATYTAVAAGLLGSTEADATFRVLAYEEDFAAVASDTARVRIVHGAATAPTVALDVGNDGTAEVPDFARWDETGAAGVELPAGEAINIGIWSGTTRVTAFTTPELPDGGELFVIATGLLENVPRAEDSFSLLAVGPDGAIGLVRQDPFVYALHAGPDAPAVDIFAAGAELVDDLDFGEISDAIQVPPGAYPLDFHGHTAGRDEPMTAPAASITTPTLMAGQEYLAVATGFLGDTPGFQLLPIGSDFDTADANARLVVVHASPDAPAVDVGTVSGGQVTAVADYEDLAFGEWSARSGTSLPADTYDLGISATGTTDALFSFSGLGLMGGDRIFAVASGSVGDGSFQLTLVDATMAPWAAIPVTPDSN